MASLVIVTKDKHCHALQIVLVPSLALLATVAPVNEGCLARVRHSLVRDLIVVLPVLQAQSLVR